MPSFNVKAWRAVRPESAKDTGVAGAIGEVDKAFKKAISAMSQAENDNAKAALNSLSEALDKGKKAIDDDKKDKDRTPALKLIKTWKDEIKTLLSDLAMNAAYAVKVAAVQKAYDERYGNVKGDVIKYHAASRDHIQRGTRPSDQDLQRYLVSVRDGGSICSKQSIPKILPEAKMVKTDDIKMPDDVKITKAKIDQLMTWCVDFAKAGKKDAKNRAGALDDTVAADKAVKAVMDGYRTVEKEMKTLIAETNRQALLAKAVAERIKGEIAKGGSDARIFNPLVKAAKQISQDLKKCDDDLRDLGDRWRAKGSPIADLVVAARKIDGFSEQTHGKLMIDRMQANQMLIRQVSIPHGDGVRQIERAKRLLSDSNNHRGFAGGI